MIQSILIARQHAINFGLSVAFESAMTSAELRCQRLGNTVGEVDYVASLVFEATPLLNGLFQRILAGTGLSIDMSAVFCHLRPQVEFKPKGGQPGCELGDLLFVHVYTDSHGNKRRNAILYQAKLGNQAIPTGSQFRLYSQWPKFKYYNSPPLSGQRTVTPPQMHSGAQYLLFDRSKPGWACPVLCGCGGFCSAGSAMPTQSLASHSCLAHEMFRFLLGTTGRPFRGPHPKLSDWSQVIWDLLQRAAAKAMNRQNSGWVDHPTLSGNWHELDGSFIGQTNLRTAFEEALNESDDGGSNRSRNKLSDENSEERGVSVVQIRSKEGG